MQPQIYVALGLGLLCLAGRVIATNSSTPTLSVKPLPLSGDDAAEASRERFRRLIPYMTFYFAQQQFGARPSFQQISGAGQTTNTNIKNFFAPTGAPYSTNGILGGALYSTNGILSGVPPTNGILGGLPPSNNGLQGGAQYSTAGQSSGALYSVNSVAPSGTLRYTSNNIAAFLAPYLVKQPNSGAVYSNSQQQQQQQQQPQSPRYNYSPSAPSVSYSSNNLVSSDGVSYNVGSSLPLVKSVPYTSNTLVPSYPQSLRLVPASGQNFAPSGTAPTYPANHARPTQTTLFTPSDPPLEAEQNYPTAAPVAAYITPSQAPPAESYRPVIRPNQPIAVTAYRTPIATRPRQSASDTLSQILDLLRAAGRLPPLEDTPIYTQLQSTPVQDPALYRVPSTTPVPKPIQSLDEDDYAYYDDDVDIQKPTQPSPKPIPFLLTPKLAPAKALTQNYPAPEGGTPGRPGVDYPILYKIPQTSFDCKTQRYKGFFGDPDTNCQVWHYCDLNGGQASFLCPNGTIFSQVGLTCDWWFNVKCDSTVQLYVLNERLYKYILPVTPSFPEDYHGPVVDRYLELKFKEKELKEEEKRKQAAAESNSTT